MNRRWILSTAVALCVGAILGFALSSMRSNPMQNESGVTSAAPGAADRKVLYWHDPMVPGQKFDKPGKSPFMDMQLVPVYADEVQREGGVRINDSVSQHLGIRLASVVKGVLPTQLRAVGSVAFDERLVELVQARVGGYVTRLYVKAPFESVRRGQPLAEILSPDWLAAQQEYLALLDGEFASIQAIRQAARQRLAVLGVPEATIRAIETDRNTHPTTTVSAPMDGVVSELSVREGSAFTAGAPLFRVSGLTSVWVNAQVPEARISMIPMGSKTIAHATAWPAESFAGRVIALFPEIDPQSRTLTARVQLENDDDKLRPGMFVSLEFIGPQAQPQLLVPSEAVITTGERTVVIVAPQAGGFAVANVTIGPDANGKSTVLSGLTEGQSVVVSGQFLIDSEASLKSTLHRLETEGIARAGEHNASDATTEKSR